MRIYINIAANKIRYKFRYQVDNGKYKFAMISIQTSHTQLDLLISPATKQNWRRLGVFDNHLDNTNSARDLQAQNLTTNL